jgi:TRAP-type mannitol/chloroaromatic compound transport system permease large subunit
VRTRERVFGIPAGGLFWFGVLLCVNMQTSFMHPPFGFALFYLRGIAPREVKSSDNYMGSIPWVVLMLIMVGIVIRLAGSRYLLPR